MNTPYMEDRCRNCPFAGTVFNPVDSNSINGMRYINCLRDNEDAKEQFMRTLKDEKDLWLRQIVEFEKCIYDYEEKL